MKDDNRSELDSTERQTMTIEATEEVLEEARRRAQAGKKPTREHVLDLVELQVRVPCEL